MAKLAVIDLAEFSDPNQKDILEASRYWGCFRVINHSIPGSLQSEMKAAVKVLFDLPDDVKHRNADVILGSGYVAPTPKNPLYESFGLYDSASLSNVDAFCSLLDAPSHVRETIKAYAESLHKVIVDIATKLAESMGLKDQNFSEWPCQFRINKYNFTQDSVGSDGVQIHTDSGFLTLLQEDECVGGLEILDPGSDSYVEVDPVLSTLLVNLGDVAKRINIAYYIKKRAKTPAEFVNNVGMEQCKAATPRFSIALFLLAPKDDKVEAPAAFIDSDHPRLYQTFKHQDYRKLCLSTGLRAGEVLSQLLI